MTVLDGPCILESLPGVGQDIFILVHVSPCDVMAKADSPNERWITLHPHGKEGGGEGKGGVHVKVKVGPDGAGHVISGPGELRGLRLTRLASPEELAERRKTRDAEKAKKRAEDQAKETEQAQADLHAAANDPAAAQGQAQAKLAKQQAEAERGAKLDDLEERMLKLREQLLSHAAGLTGDGAYTSDRAAATLTPLDYDQYKAGKKDQALDTYLKGVDPDDVPDDEKRAAKGAGAVIASRNVRQISGGLSALRKNIVRSLITDDSLRAAVLGEDDSVQASDLETGKPSGSPGYKRASGAQAREHGFTPQDAKSEANEVFHERLNEIAAENPKRAEAILAMRQGTIDRAAAERQLKSTDPTEDSTLNTPAPVRSLAPTEIGKKADQVREFLKTHDELKKLEREARAVRLGRDPDATDEEQQALDELDRPLPPGAESAEAEGVSAAFAARLESEIKDAEKQDLTRAFLDSIDSDPQHSGFASDVIRKAMHAHIGVGAHAHLANVALAALGHEGLDRQVVDTLGVEAASQLLAHAIRRDAPEQLSDIRKGLAQHHDETSLEQMREAMSTAEAARADAAEIDLPPITSTTDAAAVMQLNKERKARISEAHEALGTALGQVEAGAALNLALGGSRKALTVRFGNAPTAQAATALRALGLQDGEYELRRSPESDATLTAQITPEGMDRLTAPLDPARVKNAEAMQRIKSGAEDEDRYLPAGFVERPASSFNANPDVPPAFALPMDLTHGVEHGAEAMIASRYADGWEPSEIYAHLRDDVAPDLTPEQSEALFAHLGSLLPITKAVMKTAQDGSAYTAHEAQDLDNLPEVRARLEGMAASFMREHHPGDAGFHQQHLPDNEQTREAVFRTLAANPMLAAAFSPPGDLGGDRAGRQRAGAIKKYAEKHLLTAVPQRPEVSEEAQRDLARLDERYGVRDGEGLDKWGSSGGGGGFDLFGGAPAESGPDGPVVLKLHSSVQAAQQRLGERYTPEQREADLKEQTATQTRALSRYGLELHRDYHLSDDGTQATLTDSGKQRLTLPPSPPTAGEGRAAPDVVQSGLEGLNPQWVEYQKARNVILENDGQGEETAVGGAHTWGEFVEQMGGPKRAYAAVQERMKSDFMHGFHEHYGAVTGQGLKVSKARTAHGERLLATTNPARLATIRAERARTVAKVRQRMGGKFLAEGAGSATERADQAERDAAAARLQQGSLFGASAFGGEVQASEPRHLEVGDDERYTLGHAAESRLSQLVRSTPLGIQPGDSPVGLIKGLGWGKGRFVGAQRGVKALLSTGRLLGFYGAGSGKTGMQIGGFTQAHAEGKARKALLVCPSIVRNQFGEEAARFTTPGKYSWHARDDTYEGRKAALTGDTHMVVVTHATFRDDMIRLMAEHQGVSPEECGSRFERMDRPSRSAAYREAMAHHGIPTDYLAIDEAHDFLNRAGKGDSLMSKVAEAAMDNAKFKSLWTGSPVKNDPSEIHDWLSKVDPERFADRDSFMRRYGVNTGASREALQRLMDSYSYVDSVRPNIQRSVTWGARNEAGEAAPLPLTPQQQAAYQGVLTAFQQASKAKREDRVDVEACRTLSPRSFEGADESQHEAIATGLMQAIGTLKHAALGRVVNEFPAEHNAKVQHVLKLAGERKGKGGVVFARNRESVKMLQEQLEGAGFKVGVIDGSTTTDGKGQVRNKFDRGEVDIVIASDAGATGANLQKRGEWLVNYDLPLTHKTMEQRNARIDRLGQARAIELHHLQTETPYDHDNVRRLTRKRELGEILQGEFKSLDDQGLAGYLLRARAERRGEPMESWAEPLTPAIDENAKPPAPKMDVPDLFGTPPAPSAAAATAQA